LSEQRRIYSIQATAATPPRELALAATKATSWGVTISTYRPSGPLRAELLEDAAT